MPQFQARECLFGCRSGSHLIEVPPSKRSHLQGKGIASSASAAIKPDAIGGAGARSRCND